MIQMSWIFTIQLIYRRMLIASVTLALRFDLNYFADLRFFRRRVQNNLNDEIHLRTNSPSPPCELQTPSRGLIRLLSNP